MKEIAERFCTDAIINEFYLMKECLDILLFLMYSNLYLDIYYYYIYGVIIYFLYVPWPHKIRFLASSLPMNTFITYPLYGLFIYPMWDSVSHTPPLKFMMSSLRPCHEMLQYHLTSLTKWL